MKKSGTSCYLEAKPQGSREQPSRASLTSELAASASLGYLRRRSLRELRRSRFKSLLRSQRKKETDRNGLSLFLAEKERFELSRRVYPTYTLSRGASSANLSTSPCSNQGFIPCGSPFFKSAPLLYPILLLLSISFLTFPLFIFDFSALSIEIILRVCYNYPNGLRVHYRSKEIFYEQQQSCGLRMSLA